MRFGIQGNFKLTTGCSLYLQGKFEIFHRPEARFFWEKNDI